MALNDLRQQFKTVFGTGLDEWALGIYHDGFTDGLAADARRRAYIDDVMRKLKEKRGF